MAEADARGHFRIEGLPAGEYEVVVQVFGQGRAYMSEPERVTLGEGGEARVEPVVHLAPAPPRPRGENP
jgi:hypothetical protein